MACWDLKSWFCITHYKKEVEQEGTTIHKLALFADSDCFARGAWQSLRPQTKGASAMLQIYRIDLYKPPTDGGVRIVDGDLIIM